MKLVNPWEKVRVFLDFSLVGSILEAWPGQVWFVCLLSRVVLGWDWVMLCPVIPEACGLSPGSCPSVNLPHC